MKEEWKPSPFFPDRYEVSTWGQIRRLPFEIIANNGKIFRYKSKIIEPSKKKLSWGYYLSVNLRNSELEERVQISIAKLVAMTFLKGKKDKVFHKDRNPFNNKVDNLFWGNYEEYSEIVSKAKKNKTSKYKGVKYSKRDNLYTAQITIKRKLITIGYFKDELEAAKVYNKYVLGYRLKRKLNVID